MSAPPLPDVILEGERNATLTSAAGSMRQRGASEAAIRAALRDLNARCDPPLPEREVDRIAASVARYEPTATVEDVATEAALRRLNERYAVVKVGRDVCILEERGREFELLSERAFRLWLRNQYVTSTDERGNSRRVPIAERWLAWEGERRAYERLVFKPGLDAKYLPAGEFNLWRGWALQPEHDRRRAKAQCQLFRNHLFNAVCRQNREHFEWLADWLADIVQHPERKLGHLVALRGPQGVGKSVVGRMMRRILGVYQTVAEKPEHVVGRFNKHFAYCLLLQAEEAFWAGDHRAEAVLKHLVTGDDQQIESKGVDIISVPNYTRLLITSNADWVWPTDPGDRRVVIFEVLAKHKDDRHYWKRLFGEMEHGGDAAFLGWLLARRIDEDRLRDDPPTTEALEKQVIQSESPEDAWLRELLVNGRMPPETRFDEVGRAHVPGGALYDRYLNALPPRHRPLTATQFGLFMNERLPRREQVRYIGGARWTDARGNQHQSKGRVIASLEKCRERYSRRGRGAVQTWSKPTTWRVETSAWTSGKRN